MIRSYIGDGIKIDGRMIGYRIVTVSDYLEMKGLSDEEIEKFSDDNDEICELITQIIAVKHSCWLLRRTSHSCGSLSNGMYQLKLKLINELKEKYEYDFDDELMEEYCE
ncbi:hypothetical protein [Clostridium beijerinckii]|uniref:hypothetical protein n=1 Tax=Clostridium beijerinckii TaxID=1520 RepID=UPI00181DBC1E|nr:hypothetical protein [Clostridium beijerinckii]NRU52477.1 putative house-cleaning noncanonical NTP pyrophosphatase (MazG superfamily) [Clostridium beijerinckii]NYC69078.1 putative house-cleaning noncanonical NTP pyrophosphatase (MazG superfamily) [Clostridium beijerinckii]NYC91664.1 putative house-cleaning noncanonical NTP pyrophosphatase (MazG superfamily) [Clostridium beijerinckii]NYC91678.1 putative house-cleaning noncanonical NTP pyrophosphatase (MazG superfamily) [Clostridium beijerinck